MTQENWFIDGSISMGNLDVYKTDKTLGNYRVCMIDCDDETVSDSDLEANARLIAAAPDLLAVLEDMVFYAGMNEGWQDNNPQYVEAAKAAIAKAKGEA